MTPVQWKKRQIALVRPHVWRFVGGRCLRGPQDAWATDVKAYLSDDSVLDVLQSVGHILRDSCCRRLKIAGRWVRHRSVGTAHLELWPRHAVQSKSYRDYTGRSYVYCSASRSPMQKWGPGHRISEAGQLP